MSTVTPAGTIRIRRRIESETLHLPELKGLVGQEVEITVRAAPTAPRSGPDVPPYDFWHGPSAAEQAAAQGVKPIRSIEELRGKDLADDAFEGFEETLRQWRQEPWTSRIEDQDPQGEGR